METTTLLVLILALLIALLIAGFQYLYKKKVKSQLNYWLFTVRALSIFMILLLIIDPSIERKTPYIKKPKLLVAVDNSASIINNGQGGEISNVLNALKGSKELIDKYDVRYFSFGERLKRLDTLDFSENQSDLSLPIHQFSSLYKNEKNPVIIITDGNQTRGSAIQFLNYNAPIFPYIVGDTALSEDLSFHRINVNKFSYIDNKLPVEIFINYSGLKNVTKKLNVFHDGKVVFSKMIGFTKDQNTHTASFFLDSTKEGIQYYTARIENLENELNTANNSETFSIKVLEEQSNILMLTSVLHPDLGMLKRSIETHKYRSCDIVNIDDFNGDMADYQLLILYQPTMEFDAVWKEVQTQSKNYFIISGLHTDWSFLNRSQNEFQKETLNIIENFSPKFNTNYSTFVSEDVGFENFSPLTDKFGEITFNVPHKTLLFQKIGAIETEKPLLSTFELNDQRAAALFGENLWRWRMSSFNTHNAFEYFDGFISNLIQYLSSDLKGNRLNIDIQSMYFANETIRVSANYLDKNYNFDPRAELWLTFTNEATSFIKKIPFGLSGNQYMAELSNIPPGTYNYNVSVENEDVQVSGSFKVLEFEVEQQFKTSNRKGLVNLASTTQGSMYYSNQQATLIDNLNSDNRFKSTQEIVRNNIQLINWKWLLGLIIFTFSIEWFTRKYFGKI
jgi:hypothetical protein